MEEELKPPKKRAGKSVGKMLPGAKATKAVAPDHLTMNLFAPGMTALHRAGLGGLACTLKAMERQHEASLLRLDKLPGAMIGDEYPWTVTDDEVTLKFGTPENAANYLKKLFAFAFQIRDGVIYLPGQYPDPPPSLAVRAEMQNALTRTFLQGAKKNVTFEPTSTTYTLDPDGSGRGFITVEFKKCLTYLHQRLWRAFIDSELGELLPCPTKLDGRTINFGSIYSGAIKRHDALDPSAFTMTTPMTLCSAFFLVGCVSAQLSNSGDGVLLVPDVNNLEDISFDRPQMTPRTVSEVRTGGTADAGFQLEVRLYSRCLLLSSALPGCSAQRFALKTWTKPQKSRIDSSEFPSEAIPRVESEDRERSDVIFDQYERALAYLPRGVRVRRDETTYWFDSRIRPFVAENLGRGDSWYVGFHKLAGSRKARSSLYTETEGLHAMIRDDAMWDREEEQVIVRSVHAAMFVLRGKIANDYRDRPNLMYKKFDDEREKWGRVFSSSMTVDQFRKNLAEMFRRAGNNSELQSNWLLVLRMLRPATWQLARDLALIGLSSYQPRTDSSREDTTQQN